MQNTAIFYVEILFKNSVISSTKNKRRLKSMIPNFIFEPTTWKIVIAVLLSIIIIFMVRYYLDLRDGNVAEANGKLIIVCGMICSMTIAFLLLALTQSLTL